MIDSYSLDSYKDLTSSMFSEIHIAANLISTLPKAEGLNVCVRINRIFQDLMQKTNDYIVGKNREQEITGVLLVDATRLYNTAFQLCEDSKRNLQQLEAESMRLANKIIALNGAMKQLNLEINDLKDKIAKEEHKRINAAVDAIPIVGFFAGLITGEYERMIPYHSLVTGLISTFSQELEACQHKLEKCQEENQGIAREISQNNQSISVQKQHITETEKKINEKETEKNQLDNKIKELGKQLTQLANVQQSLKQISLKYSFLQMDVALIETLVDNEILDGDGASDFLSDIKNINNTVLMLI